MFWKYIIAGDDWKLWHNWYHIEYGRSRPSEQCNKSSWSKGIKIGLLLILLKMNNKTAICKRANKIWQGIVERWLDQLEDSMIQSLCDINNKAVRNYSGTPITQWVFQWPAMVSYCAFYINWTMDVEANLKPDQLLVSNFFFLSIPCHFLIQAVTSHPVSINHLSLLLLFFCNTVVVGWIIFINGAKSEVARRVRRYTCI